MFPTGSLLTWYLSKADLHFPLLVSCYYNLSEDECKILENENINDIHIDNILFFKYKKVLQVKFEYNKNSDNKTMFNLHHKIGKSRKYTQ